ncbi:MAG TPA: hypothetical protein H9684_05255 [Firmicutes bacterium]|nr:hypothetical protein [Bacillota bacterium]
MDKRQKKPGAADRASRVREDARTLREQGRGDIPSDVLGSYTGTPDRGEVPEQDADDL